MIKPYIHNREADEVHMRLARSNVVGMRDYLSDEHDYTEKAFKRFMTICRPREPQARSIFERMLALLSEARLTINFQAHSFFHKECVDDSYSNCFERAQQMGINPHTIKGKRNQVEQDLFDYRGHSKAYIRPRGPAPQTPLARYGNAQAVRKEIEHYAVRSDLFPMMHPRYGALDFGWCTHGAAGRARYGRSFFVLQDHMKAAATYTPSDSFYIGMDLKQRKGEYGGTAPTPHQILARVHEMPKVLYYCHPGMLEQIYLYGSGKKTRGSEKHIDWVQPGSNTLNYIEAQLHSDVLFSRDLKGIVISDEDVRESCHSAYGRYQIQKFAEIFGRKHGVPVAYGP